MAGVLIKRIPVEEIRIQREDDVKTENAIYKPRNAKMTSKPPGARREARGRWPFQALGGTSTGLTP